VLFIRLNLTPIKNNFTRFDLALVFVKKLMRGLIFKCHQVLRAIIFFYSIKMMDSFRFFKKTPDHFFYHKPVFQNIIVMRSVRMIWTKNENVIAIIRNAAIPFRIFFSIYSPFTSKTYFSSMFIGKNLSSVCKPDFFYKLWRHFSTFIKQAQVFITALFGTSFSSTLFKMRRSYIKFLRANQTISNHILKPMLVM